MRRRTASDPHLPARPADRLGRVHEVMRGGDAGALLVTDRTNVRWLTGFTGSAGHVYVPTEGEALLVTDGRYTERAGEEAPDWTVVIDRTWGWLGEHHRPDASLAVEADVMPWEVVRTLTDLGVAAALQPTSGLVATLRQIKDDDEIALLRRACEITAQAFDHALGWLQPGLTEVEVAQRLIADMVAAGADGSAFDPIVASGPNGSRPHHSPGQRVLASGDLVTMDFGALVAGYHADMTRTVALGTVDLAQRRIYDLVHAAQQAGVAAALDGADVVEVDRACRQLIAKAGHGEHFEHGTGHGVGLGLHETPFLGPTSAGTLRDRMTVTVEPGVYVPGLGGVRIEDVVLVTTTGADRLTQAQRDLVQL